MNILLLAPHPFLQTRGTPLAERAVIEVLTGQGHRVTVLAYPEGDDPELPGCRVERLRGRWLPRGIRPGISWRKLLCDAAMLRHCLKMVSTGEYALVHAVEEAAFMAMVAHWRYGVPYVADMDSVLAEQAISQWRFLRPLAGLWRRCERTMVRRSLGVLAVCPAVEDHARALWPGAIVRRLEDPSLLGESEPAAGAEPPAPVVLYVGNLEPYQGIELLLEGFAIAWRQVPAARLVIAGAGDSPRRRALARAAKRLGVAGAVEWMGPQPIERLGELLRGASVLVSPRTGGANTPMKIYSYLDSGRPLLATRILSHLQVLDDRLACLVEPDAGSFGAGLLRLLNDRGLRARLAAAAREHARREFSRGAFARKLVAFYGEIAERLDRHQASSAPAEAAG